MPLSPEARVLLNRGSEYLGERTNIRDLSQAIRREPELLTVALHELDTAITSLNGMLLIPDDSDGAATQEVLLPNAVNLARNLFPHNKLPTIADLIVGYAFAADDCKDAFKRVNGLMRKGEEETDPSGWRFHMEELDPAVFIDALVLEIYNERLRLFSRISGLPNRSILLALEEMLAVRHPDSRMYGSVAQWYSEEEGFSSLLVGMVSGEVRIPFSNGQVLRRTDNFRVVDGYKPRLEEQDRGQRFYIEPLNYGAEKLLEAAAIAHNISQNMTPRVVPDQISNKPSLRKALRVDRVATNIRALFGGYTEIPVKGQDTIPSPDRMEIVLAKHPRPYTFRD